MPKIIVTSRYLKSGSKKNLANYVKYVATREGSVAVKNIDENAPATKNQQELILSLLNDFPDSKELFEYEDYVKKPNFKNGSALISEVIDRNMDRLTNRRNYVGYLANRPGSVKLGSHGLFNEKDEPIDLERVAKEVADHGGNVWTHVVSLRRDDAQKMGYDNLTAWRELVKRQIPKIAKNSKINLTNLKWYAAFHDKKTNPHVHIIVYSTEEREGFLTNHGIEKIRSGFANDIYSDELHHIYEQQTDLRNLLKKESEQLMKGLAEKISQDNNFDPELMNLVSKLHDQLAESKGKKVYGYLKSDVKKTVDEIFTRLADNESVKKMYDLWCEMEQQKHDVYSSAKVNFPLLVDNKEFKSVKNMIIQTVLQMDFQAPEIEVEMPEPDMDIPLPIDEDVGNETVDNSVEDSTQNKLYIKWSDSYKEAHNLILRSESTPDDYKKAKNLLLSESNNVLALYDLGKLYSIKKSSLKDNEKSFEFYKNALQGFIQIEPKAKKIKPYLQYQIGMMYFKGLGTPVDNQKAAEYFEKSAELGNQYAKRLLAFEYISGKNFEQNIDKGIPLLTEFADSGDAFSCYKLGTLYLKGEIVNQDLDKAEKYLLSAEDNEFTQYALGKLYLQKEKYDIQKAISYFEKSADKNMWANYQLGRLYFFGAEDLEKDKEKAIQYLYLSAEQGNEYAQNILDDQEKFENEMLANTIFSLFINLSRCIEDDYHHKFQSGRKMIDSKLRRVIQEKKQSLGIKNEQNLGQSY
ncbi:MAG: SEL1-like repeat protein [Ruminococcus sp.]|nr:SEL1-like repeat protein [Ruminococcus sp.]